MTRKGFTTLEIIIIALVIALVGTAGWLAYQNANEKQPANSAPEKTTNQSIEISDEGTDQSSVIEINEWGVQMNISSDDVIYKIQNNIAYLSTSSVENTPECKEIRAIYPEYFYGIVRHDDLTDELYNQPPEIDQQGKTVQLGLQTSEFVKKVGDYYYELFKGNGIDCAPPTVDFGESFKTLKVR